MTVLSLGNAATRPSCETIGWIPPMTEAASIFLSRTIRVTYSSPLVSAGGFQSGSAAGEPSLARGHNLDDLAGLNGGEAFYLEDGLKDRVGLFGSDLARRDDGDLAAHGFVDDEVAAGDLADELGKKGNIHVLKLN